MVVSEQDINDKNMDDEAAMEAEDRENELREANRKEFLRWAQTSEEIVQKEDQAFFFDVPSNVVQFEGTVKNNRVDMMAAGHSLVCLTEWPPVIVALDTVEFICAERYFPLDPSTKSFDLSFIGKDLKTVMTIDSVPAKQ